MPPVRTLRGSMLGTGVPVWAPLEELLGVELCEWLMWMFAVRLQDGRSLHAYKHIATRRYLHLALDGSAFAFVRGRYRPIARADAIAGAFAGWDELFPEPDDPGAVRAALARATARARHAA